MYTLWVKILEAFEQTAKINKNLYFTIKFYSNSIRHTLHNTSQIESEIKMLLF